MLHRFSKSERLCNQIQIQAIFKKGKAIKSYPFLFIHLSNQELELVLNAEHANRLEILGPPETRELRCRADGGLSPIQVVVSVSSKKHKRAVARNRIKRKIRELYRCSKPMLLEGNQGLKRHYLVILYMSGKEYDFEEMSKAFEEGIKKLKHEIQ